MNLLAWKSTFYKNAEEWLGAFLYWFLAKLST